MAHTPTITRQYTGQTSPTLDGGIERWFFEFDDEQRFRIGITDAYSPLVSDWYDPNDIAAINTGSGAAADQLFHGCISSPLPSVPVLRIFTITELPS